MTTQNSSATPSTDPAELFDLPEKGDPTAFIALLARAESAVGELADLLGPLASAFAAEGESLFLVGGPVRDAMLGRLGLSLIHI